MIRRFLLVGCFVLVAGPAALRASGTEIVELGESPVRLLAPAAEVAWTAGGEIDLAWEPLGGALDADAEEWEAFLSLDGGHSWPVRLTPHLAIDRRRIRVRVPDLPTEDARLLFRIGDEREERAALLPEHFRIVREDTVPRDVAAAAPTSGYTRGESALAGADETVFWADGARDGSGWQERSSRTAGFRDSGSGLSADIEPPLVAESESRPTVAAPAADRRDRATAASSSTRSGRPSAPARSQDLLLLLSRRNE